MLPHLARCDANPQPEYPKVHAGPVMGDEHDVLSPCRHREHPSVAMAVLLKTKNKAGQLFRRSHTMQKEAAMSVGGLSRDNTAQRTPDCYDELSKQ